MNTEYQRTPFLRLIRERLGRNGKGGYQKKNLDDNKQTFILIVLLRREKRKHKTSESSLCTAKLPTE